MTSLRRTKPNELTGEVTLVGVPLPIELVVETSEAEPLPFQSEALAAFITAWASRREAIERALYAYYRETALGVTESGPSIASAQHVWPHVSLSGLRVLAVQQAGKGVVQVTGGCSWEEEHGLELDFVAGSELVYVGQYDGTGYSPSHASLPWNFASPEAQGVALERSDAVDPEPQEEAPVQRNASRAERKPWWKLW